MNVRAILFAITGVLLFGGIAAYWTMSDMRRIRQENAAQTGLQQQQQPVNQATATPAPDTSGQPSNSTTYPNDGTQQSQDSYGDSSTNQYGQDQAAGSDPNAMNGDGTAYGQPDQGTSQSQTYDPQVGTAGGTSSGSTYSQPSSGSQNYGTDPSYSTN